MAKVFDGKVAAESLRLKTLTEFPSHVTTLAIIRVGEDPRSRSYVSGKLKTAVKWGIKVQHVELSRLSSEKEIRETILALNRDEKVTGMILQLPPDVASPLSAEKIHSLLETILPTKDADGLVSKNLGALMALGQKSGAPIPATPLGILRLLEHYEVPVEGRDICILGKSRLVGLPLAVLLSHRGATVTLCHSQSKAAHEKAQRSDILIAATGVCGLVKANHVNARQVLIDVGIVSTADGLRGDVDHAVYETVSGYSPVPGGVGPMTVAALMENTIRLGKRS